MILSDHIDPFGKSSKRVFWFAYLNSFHETGIKGTANKAILGQENINPLDLAILLHDHPDVHTYKKIDELPFDFERKRVSVIVGNRSKRLLITKGAPENIFSICESLEDKGKLREIDQETLSLVNQTFNQLSEKGFRILAVAFRTLPVQDKYKLNDESKLTFAGFWFLRIRFFLKFLILLKI